MNQCDQFIDRLATKTREKIIVWHPLTKENLKEIVLMLDGFYTVRKEWTVIVGRRKSGPCIAVSNENFEHLYYFSDYEFSKPEAVSELYHLLRGKTEEITKLIEEILKDL